MFLRYPENREGKTLRNFGKITHQQDIKLKKTAILNNVVKISNQTFPEMFDFVKRGVIKN
jgi:hypothetical protein